MSSLRKFPPCTLLSHFGDVKDTLSACRQITRFIRFASQDCWPIGTETLENLIIGQSVDFVT